MSKRFQRERAPEVCIPSSRRPSVPEETVAQLFHVGARARKHVSDGHLAPGASRYSYRPNVDSAVAAPNYDRCEFKDLRQPSDLQLRAEQHRRDPIKRKYTQQEGIDGSGMDVGGDTDDDQATDVDEEDDLPAKPQSMTSIKAFYVPSNYKAGDDVDQPMTDDFDEVSFLQPRESFNQQ